MDKNLERIVDGHIARLEEGDHIDQSAALVFREVIDGMRRELVGVRAALTASEEAKAHMHDEQKKVLRDLDAALKENDMLRRLPPFPLGHFNCAGRYVWPEAQKLADMENYAVQAAACSGKSPLYHKSEIRRLLAEGKTLEQAGETVVQAYRSGGSIQNLEKGPQPVEVLLADFMAAYNEGLKKDNPTIITNAASRLYSELKERGCAI